MRFTVSVGVQKTSYRFIKIGVFSVYGYTAKTTVYMEIKKL